MASLEKIGHNYVEQVHTTLETMRRRCLALYDRGEEIASGFGSHLTTLNGWVDDAITFVKEDEPIKQQIISDICDQKSLDPEDKKKRNTVQELYFGLSIVMMALGAGQLTGLLWSASILSSLFSPVVELGLLLLLPIYAYLKLKKVFHDYDDAERRDWLYAFVFCAGMLFGNLRGFCLLATTPTVFFLPPLVFALVIDLELCPKTVYCNRNLVLTVAALLSFVSMQALSFVTGMHGSVSSLAIIVQCIAMAVHFQLVVGHIDRLKDGSEKFPTSEAQLLYVLAMVLVQLPLTLFSAGSPK